MRPSAKLGRFFLRYLCRKDSMRFKGDITDIDEACDTAYLPEMQVRSYWLRVQPKLHSAMAARTIPQPAPAPSPIQNDPFAQGRPPG